MHGARIYRRFPLEYSLIYEPVFYIHKASTCRNIFSNFSLCDTFEVLHESRISPWSSGFVEEFCQTHERVTLSNMDEAKEEEPAKPSEISTPGTSRAVQRRNITFKTPVSRSAVGRSTTTYSAKKLRGAFKSPLRETGDHKDHSKEDSESLRTEIDSMLSREKELDQDIKKLRDEGYRIEDLDNHIRTLHEYNEMKDVGQMLLGSIATQKGLTTKDLYEEYGLGLDD